MNKKVLGFAAISLILIASCSKNETFDDEVPPKVIEFTKLNDRVPNKAANDSASNYGVYAFLKNGNPAATTWFADNLKIDGGNNSYTPLKFWPKEGTIDFYSYAPFNSPNLDLSGVQWNAVNPTFDIVYTVPANADEDLTIASPVLDASGSTVNFIFSHMLAKLSFEANLESPLVDDGFTMTLNHVTLSVNYEEGENTLDAPSGWSHTVAPAKVTYTNKRTYLIMPQPATNLEITLNVTVKHNGADYYNGNLKTSVLATVPNITGFDKGTNYHFTVTVGNLSQDDQGNPVFNVILFTSNITPWNTETIPVPQP